MKRDMRHTAGHTAASLAVILLIWWAASACMQKYFLPDPPRVFSALAKLLSQKEIWLHLWASLRRLLLGTLIGLAFAVPLGVAMGRIRAVDEILGAFFRFVYPIPKVVFMPIIVVMLGIGDTAKIFLIFIAIFFQMTIIIRDSVASLDQEFSEIMIAMKATPSQTLKWVILPGCLPGILTALKSTLGTSVALLMITELFASTSGLGYYIMNCMDSRNYPQMYAGIVLLAVMSALLYGFIEFMERWLCSWNYSYRA